MTNILLVQLAALAVHLDAVSQAIQQEIRGAAPQVPQGGCPECDASEEFVEDASTFGHPTSRCTKCNVEWARDA